MFENRILRIPFSLEVDYQFCGVYVIHRLPCYINMLLLKWFKDIPFLFLNYTKSSW